MNTCLVNSVLIEGINGSTCEEMTLNLCSFMNINSATKGGCIYFDNLNKRAHIQSTIFHQCEGNQYGAFAITCKTFLGISVFAQYCDSITGADACEYIETITLVKIEKSVVAYSTNEDPTAVGVVKIKRELLDLDNFNLTNCVGSCLISEHSDEYRYAGTSFLNIIGCHGNLLYNTDYTRNYGSFYGMSCVSNNGTQDDYVFKFARYYFITFAFFIFNNDYLFICEKNTYLNFYSGCFNNFMELEGNCVTDFGLGELKPAPTFPTQSPVPSEIGDAQKKINYGLYIGVPAAVLVVIVVVIIIVVKKKGSNRPFDIMDIDGVGEASDDLFAGYPDVSNNNNNQT